MRIGELTFLVVRRIYFFAPSAKGSTGLGISKTCLQLLLPTVGLREGMALLIVLSLTPNVSVMVGGYGRWRLLAVGWHVEARGHRDIQPSSDGRRIRK